MSSGYRQFHDDDNRDGQREIDSFQNNVNSDSLQSSSDAVDRLEAAQPQNVDEVNSNVPGSFAATQAPDSTSNASSGNSRDSGSSGSNSNSFFSLTKKKKKKALPKHQASGIVNYGGIGIGQDSDSEAESDASTVNQHVVNFPLPMQSAFPNPQINDQIDDDEWSQRTPIPKVPPNSTANAILKSDFLRSRTQPGGANTTDLANENPGSSVDAILKSNLFRTRTQSSANMSDISDDDSIMRRQQKEEENVGRLVNTAKQQHSFAQAWFSVGQQTQNALPPIPLKAKPPVIKKTKIVVPSTPIDLDSGEPWNIDHDKGATQRKTNWGDLGTTHSTPTKKATNKNKKMLHFGVPDDEDLTTYYVENGFLERIACTFCDMRCSNLALLVIGSFILLLTGGAISAGVFLSAQGNGKIMPSTVPSAAPSISIQPTISSIPSFVPTTQPTMTPSFNPSSKPSSTPSLRPSSRPSPTPSLYPSPEPSGSPSSTPSSSPTDYPSATPSSQPTLSSQPTSSPSAQPSSCFTDVNYLSQGQLQRLSGSYNGDRNGHSVSLSEDGTIIAVSALQFPEGTGSVTIYEQVFSNNQGIQWLPKGQRIEGDGNIDGFGNSIELSNDGLTVIIGHTTAENGGFARVFGFNSATNKWERIGTDLTQENTLLYGFSVAISGDGRIVAVGDADGYGRVDVYQYDGTDWETRGPPMTGLSSFGEFGYSLSLSLNGNIVACGAPRGGTYIYSIAGSVRILKWNPSVPGWEVLGAEIESSEFGSARFGASISMAEDETNPRIAIGSTNSMVDFKSASGSVSVWEYDDSSDSWSQVGQDMIGNPTAQQRFGSSVSIAGEGTHVAVGMPLAVSGRAYVYFWNGNIWDEADPLDGNSFDSGFGSSVDLSKDGTSLAVGASSQSSQGYSQVFKSNKDCEYS